MIAAERNSTLHLQSMIPRSLNPDQGDAAKLRHGYDVNEGRPLPRVWGNYYPFFFTRESATLHITEMARGGAAFLIAGGPSFGEIPKEPLRRVWTMTLNNAVKSFRSNANCIVDPPSQFSFSMWLDPLITKFVPAAHFEKPLWDNRRMRVNGEWVQRWESTKLKVGDCPNVVGYRRNEKFHAPRWLHEETINWGNHKKHGGGRSVMLAAVRILYLLGFRRVYLLGVDLDMTPDRRYHFAEQRTASSISGNMSTYSKLQRWFSLLQPFFLKEGFIVKNCNLHSKLTAFPHIPFEEAIDEATSHLGDYSLERTEGMYQKLEAKLGVVTPPEVDPRTTVAQPKGK